MIQAPVSGKSYLYWPGVWQRRAYALVEGQGLRGNMNHSRFDDVAEADAALRCLTERMHVNVMRLHRQESICYSAVPLVLWVWPPENIPHETTKSRLGVSRK